MLSSGGLGEGLQKSLHPQIEEWAESQFWPIRISDAPYRVRDLWKTQSDPRRLVIGMSTNWGLQSVSVSSGAILRRPVWIFEAVVETRVKSGERPEPSPLPRHLQSPDPINFFLSLSWFVWEFLSLAVETPNSPGS